LQVDLLSVQNLMSSLEKVVIQGINFKI